MGCIQIDKELQNPTDKKCDLIKLSRMTYTDCIVHIVVYLLSTNRPSDCENGRETERDGQTNRDRGTNGQTERYIFKQAIELIDKIHNLLYIGLPRAQAVVQIYSHTDSEAESDGPGGRHTYRQAQLQPNGRSDTAPHKLNMDLG